MFRFLFKWSLQITGASMVGYQFLPAQKQADLYGAYRSVTNSSRASTILFKSVYDYYYELKPIPYNTEQYHKKRSQIHSRTANRILKLSKQNKGIYLKLGQYLGNLDKVVPWEFTEVLKVLQDSGPSISYDEIKVVIEEDLKMKPKDAFDMFGKNAFAAASLAQVHKATLNDSFRDVAVKIQFPFLRTQSKWDLYMLRNVTNLCSYLLKRWDYKQLNLQKLFDTWTNTLVEELDFKKQIENAKRTKQLFKNNKTVKIPYIYERLSSDRIIVMEYMEGAKINEPDKIKQMGIDTHVVAKNLVNIFGTMIFKYGFVHCDAHPGNILVRKAKNKLGHQIVLLDHGLYRQIPKQVIKDFSQLWKALILSDKKKVIEYSKKLNIQKHFDYLPIIFLHRTVQSKKKLGEPITKQERQYFRSKDIANFQSINAILQDIPPDLMFIIRATNLVSIHNRTLGGSQRERMLTYTKMCLQNCNNTSFGEMSVALRIWIFQNFYGLYRWAFGTLN